MKDQPLQTSKPHIMITKKTGCGSIYCTFVEHNNGNFHKLMLFSEMSKETPCGSSWLWSMQKILTYALRRSMKDNNLDVAILKHLLNQSCNKKLPNAEHVSSCVDAIAKAVKTYLKKHKESKPE